MAQPGRRGQRHRCEPAPARGARAPHGPLALRRRPQGQLAAPRVLPGRARQLRRDRARRRRGDAEPRTGHRARAARPRPHLRPTLGEGHRTHRARLLSPQEETRMENVNLDLVHLIQQGAISTCPLLACAVIMLGVVIERLWSLRGAVSSTASLTAELVSLLARGDLKGAADAVRRTRPCPARRVFGDVLAAASGESLPDLERVADERQFEEIEGCGSYLWVLGTIGSSAPFIGLFGTVIGIMRAFHSMALVGTGGFGVVAGGISEALIATALGLAIGIVALVFYNYLQNRVERIDGALRIGSARLLEAMAAVRRSHGAV